MHRRHVKREDLERLRTEMKLCNRVQHPNIVQFLGASIDKPPNVCILLELVSGGDLSGFIYEEGFPVEDQVVIGTVLVDDRDRQFVTRGQANKLGGMACMLADDEWRCAGYQEQPHTRGCKVGDWIQGVSISAGDITGLPGILAQHYAEVHENTAKYVFFVVFFKQGCSGDRFF